MSTTVLLYIAAGAAGVLATKALPSLVLPRTLPAWADRALAYLPVCVLAAFTGFGAFPHALASTQPVLFVAALALAAALVIRTRRLFVSLLAGWAALVGLHLVGLY